MSSLSCIKDANQTTPGTCQGSCFSGSNNIHWDSPPIMADGRVWASWQPESVINNRLQLANNIQTNWSYRQYLQKNAIRIMNFNNIENCYDIGLECQKGVIKNSEYSKNVPFLYQNVFDNNKPVYGYCNSDLKSPYLSREQLNARLIAPYIDMSGYM